LGNRIYDRKCCAYELQVIRREALRHQDPSMRIRRTTKSLLAVFSEVNAPAAYAH
jgi:hypothetical protein